MMAKRLLERHRWRSAVGNAWRSAAVNSTFVRPAHQPHGCFDVPPSLGLLALALLLEVASLLSGFGYGLVTVSFQQLPRIVLDFDFLHSHGVMLLFVSAIDVTIAHGNVGR
jgi:hypothetical protein